MWRVDGGVRDRFFDLVGSGVSLTESCRRVGVARRTGQRWWKHAGGMVLPSVKRSVSDRDLPEFDWLAALAVPPGPGHRLCLGDRINIEVGLAAHRSQSEIASRIGRDASVVCRELARNTGLDGVYRASTAHQRAQSKARRPKAFKVLTSGTVEFIDKHLRRGWSPRLISQTLKQRYPDDRTMQISHETIYQCLYVQSRGQLRKDLTTLLSLKRKARKSQESVRAGEKRGRFNDAFTISERPAEAADRAVPGHWEGDLIIGKNGASAIGTLVERSTRYVILLHLPEDHTAASVTTAMIKEMSKLPQTLLRSITWDRGPEIAGHHELRMALKAPVYLCDPHSPWQRGSNENTNRLLRHWFPKGTNLATHSAKYLREVAKDLNDRPRPTLNYDTPTQRMDKLLQETAAQAANIALTN